MAEMTPELRVTFDSMLHEIQTLNQAVGGYRQESERLRVCCHELVTKLVTLTGVIHGINNTK